MPAIRGAKSKKKTRRYTRDVDQVQADLNDENHLARFKNTKAAEDLPAGGLYYCVECAKWFEQEANLKAHLHGKVHKRRLKQLKAGPHTQREADEAVGLRTDNGRRERPDEMAVETA